MIADGLLENYFQQACLTAFVRLRNTGLGLAIKHKVSLKFLITKKLTEQAGYVGVIPCKSNLSYDLNGSDTDHSA